MDLPKLPPSLQRIFDLVQRGYTAQQIAAELHLSEKSMATKIKKALSRTCLRRHEAIMRYTVKQASEQDTLGDEFKSAYNVMQQLTAQQQHVFEAYLGMWIAFTSRPQGDDRQPPTYLNLMPALQLDSASSVRNMMWRAITATKATGIHQLLQWGFMARLWQYQTDDKPEQINALRQQLCVMRAPVAPPPVQHLPGATLQEVLSFIDSHGGSDALPVSEFKTAYHAVSQLTELRQQVLGAHLRLHQLHTDGTNPPTLWTVAKKLGLKHKHVYAAAKAAAQKLGFASYVDHFPQVLGQYYMASLYTVLSPEES